MILSMILSIYAWGSLIQLHFSMSKWANKQTSERASKRVSEWCEWASKRKSEQMNEQASDPLSPQMHLAHSGPWVSERASERVTHFPRIHPIVDFFFQINTKLHWLGKKSKLIRFFDSWGRNPVFQFSLEAFGKVWGIFGPLGPSDEIDRVCTSDNSTPSGAY